MDNSAVTIFGYAFHGLQEKAVFLTFIASIFAFGCLVGHRMGVDEVASAVNTKIDQLHKTD